MADQTSAASLPGGSVVVDDLKGIAYYAVGDPGEMPGERWEMTVSPQGDSTVDYHLRHGALVVRVGDTYPPAPTLAPDARERLARHLQMQSVATLDECRAHAAAILNVITGQEASRG